MNPEMMSIKEVLRLFSKRSCTTFLSPLIATARVHQKLSKKYCFFHYGQLLSLIPGMIGWEIRQAFYQATLRTCGPNLKMEFGSYFVSPETEVGENVVIGAYCVIGRCTIGNDVLLASHVSILDGLYQHSFANLDIPIVDQPRYSEHVSIGDHTWIGEGARVAASIGNKSIVGVGSVVTRPIQPEVIVLGNPARVVGHRANPLNFLGKQSKII